MQLSNTSQYAVRIMSYIANSSQNKLYSAKELSDILSIPYKFLTKIMAELVRSEYIISVRGRDGGYKLSKPASSITVLEILNQFNEFLDSKDCLLGIGKCDGKNKCGLHDQWAKPKNMIQKMFKNTTLNEVDGDNFKL